MVSSIPWAEEEFKKRRGDEEALSVMLNDYDIATQIEQELGKEWSRTLIKNQLHIWENGVCKVETEDGPENGNEKMLLDT